MEDNYDWDGELGELEPSLHPGLMHIDGDILERCLQRRALEELVQDAGRFRLFCQYLDRLEGGRHTRGFEADSTGDEERRGRYLGLAYEILAYLLDVVM